MSNDVVEMFPEGVVYFTTRKVKGGWIAEKLFMKDGILVREQLGALGRRANAMEQFKINIAMYWAWQRKHLL